MVYDCAQALDFEWDPKKAYLNHHKHAVQFADAVAVLEDENALTTFEQAADGEERFVTFGADALGRILVVVYTWRRSRVRIISARKATTGERRRYVETL
jgi:uncharacterized DUF497 family protein